MTPHGSPSTYTNHSCRCEECRAAWATYNTGRRAARAESLVADPSIVTHGSNSTYVNYACRCGECRDAHAAARLAQYRARKARST